MLNNKDLAKTSFVVAGAARSGHSSIHHCLAQHPYIEVLPTERSDFFHHDVLFEKGRPDYIQYESRYQNTRPSPVRGEVSNLYFSHPMGFNRLYHYNPNLKIIVCLRNPAERAYSQWQSAAYQGIEDRSFSEAIQHEKASLDQLTHSNHTSYLHASMYADQIGYLHQYFDPHQLLFVKSEDLRDDTDVMLYRIFQFLSVPYTQVDTTAQNIGHYTASISTHDYALVTELLEKDILSTEEHLGWNCKDWLERPVTSVNEGVLV